MSSRPTIMDVAAAAGVSRTQASDALRGRGRVDLGTRDRVIAAAAQLGYHANLSARSLREGRTGIIALVLPTMEAEGEESEALGLDYYTRVTSAVASAAFLQGYAVVLVPPLDGPAQLYEIPFDGAIVSDPEAGDKRLAVLDARRLPVVTIDRDVTRDDPLYVATDTERNTRLLLDHLADCGATRVALLSPDATWAWILETTQAYRAWSRERGREPIVVTVPLRRLEGSSYDACLELLGRRERPDALFALADRYALGALRAASDLDIRVPDQLLIAAGVDSHASAEIRPSITALELHPERSAMLAVELLAGRLAGENVQAPRTVTGELVARESTRR